MKKILKIILVIIFAYITLCVYLFFMQKYIIFYPSKEIFAFPEQENLKEIYIETEDRIKLNAWFLDNGSDKTVLFFHGNGGNIYFNKERIKIFTGLHLNALLLDYRGYGKSEGKIEKEEDLYTDADATYSYLIKEGIKPENIIIWGQSLGGAIAIHLAQNKNIYKVIVESAFYSMDKMANEMFWSLPINWILKFHFKNYEKILNITSPILVIHSIDDEMIKFSNGKQLFDKISGNQKLFLKTKGSHNRGFQESYDLYFSTIKEFLKM